MEPVQLSTWTQLRRHFRSWLASLFGAPAESEVLSALAGGAPGVSPLAHGAGAAQEALLPGQHQGSLQLLRRCRLSSRSTPRCWPTWLSGATTTSWATQWSNTRHSRA